MIYDIRYTIRLTILMSLSMLFVNISVIFSMRIMNVQVGPFGTYLIFRSSWLLAYEVIDKSRHGKNSYFAAQSIPGNLYNEDAAFRRQQITKYLNCVYLGFFQQRTIGVKS